MLTKVQKLKRLNLSIRSQNRKSLYLRRRSKKKKVEYLVLDPTTSMISKKDLEEESLPMDKEYQQRKLEAQDLLLIILKISHKNPNLRQQLGVKKDKLSKARIYLAREAISSLKLKSFLRDKEP